MKRKILHMGLSLLLFVMALPSLANEPTALHLLFADGSDKWFLFSSQPVVTFSADELTVTTYDAAVVFTFDAVKEFLFDTPDEDGILRNPQTPRIVQAGNAVLVYGSATDAVSLYDLSGRKLGANVQRQDDAVSISLQSLPTGIYVIRINNQSIKVTKK